MGKFSRRQIVDIFLIFPGDNLYELSNLFTEKNKKNMSKCHLLNILSVKERAFDLDGHFLGLWLLTHAFSSKDLICPFICVHMINHGSFGLKGKLINSDSNPC